MQKLKNDANPFISAHATAYEIKAHVQMEKLLEALNMMDGIDGLAGGISIVAILAVLAFQASTGSFKHVDMLLILGVVLIPYLASNLGLFGLPKIFLGDAGSMLIGYIIAWTLIILTQGATVSIEPVNVLWCVAVPLLDMWALMYRRIREKKSPFSADRGHVHYLLMRYGATDRLALLTLLLLAICAVLGGIVLSYLAPGISFFAFLTLIVVHTLVSHSLDRGRSESDYQPLS